MEERKQKEIEYYDRQIEESTGKGKKKGDFEGFNPNILSSFSFCYQWLKENCQNKKVLDYGCGNGVHSVFLAKTGAERVVGIDLFNNADIFNSFDEISKIIRKSSFEIYEIPVHPGYPSNKLLEYDWYCDQRLRELDLLKNKTVLLKMKDFRIASFNELCCEY